MTEISRAVDIAAPAQAVYRELVDLHRLSRWSTITESHEGPDVLEQGQEFRQKIRIGGIRLPTRWRCVEYDAPRAVAYEATAPLGGRLYMRQVVAPHPGGVSVQLVDYDLPGRFVGRALDGWYVRRRNEAEAQRSLERLRDLVEGLEGGRSAANGTS